MKSLAAIILARMDSSRFPGKHLTNLGGLPVIEHIRLRLNQCGLFNAGIVLATTGRTCDQPLVKQFTDAGGLVYLAPDEEVSAVARRFVSAAESVGADYALRVNGDSPFPDRWLIEAGNKLVQQEEPDLVSNLITRTYPYGVSVEFVRVTSLKKLLGTLTTTEQEHVTKCFYSSPAKFRLSSVPPCPWAWNDLKFTIDEPSDLDSLNVVISHLSIPVLNADLPALITAAFAAVSRLD